MPPSADTSAQTVSPTRGSRAVRVLHVYSGNLWGGVEQMLRTIAVHRAGVPQLRHSFALCYTGRLSGELAAAGCAPFDLGPVRFSRPWTVLSARRRLRGLFNVDPVDVVVTHSSWAHAIFAPVVRAAGVALCHWSHDLPGSTHWTARLARRTPPDLVIANSRFTLDSAGELFCRTPARCIYCPLSHWQPAEVAETSLRSAFGGAPEACVVLIAARFEEWKGHRVLLRAASRVHAGGKPWELWIAGEPQRPAERRYAAELRSLASELGDRPTVRWLGHRSDMPAVLAAADVYCQPNTGPEPFGLAIAEAMGTGLAVVATQLGATPELLDDGRAGILCPPGDVDAVASALSALIADPSLRRTLGVSARERAVAMCDPVGRLEELHAALSSVVGVK